MNKSAVDDCGRMTRCSLVLQHEWRMQRPKCGGEPKVGAYDKSCIVPCEAVPLPLPRLSFSGDSDRLPPRLTIPASHVRCTLPPYLLAVFLQHTGLELHVLVERADDDALLASLEVKDAAD